MQLGNDPHGGLDKIAAGCAAHMTEADNDELRRIIGNYMTGAKNLVNDMPNGDKWLEKYHASLAAEDAIRGWVELSEGAMEKFMKDNFNKVWDRFDQNGEGHIDTTSTLPFMRDLMNVLSPGIDTSKDENPYDFSIINGKIWTTAEIKAAKEAAAKASTKTQATTASTKDSSKTTSATSEATKTTSTESTKSESTKETSTSKTSSTTSETTKEEATKSTDVKSLDALVQLNSSLEWPSSADPVARKGGLQGASSQQTLGNSHHARQTHPAGSVHASSDSKPTHHQD